MDAILWRLRTGSLWRGVPGGFDFWKKVDNYVSRRNSDGALEESNNDCSSGPCMPMAFPRILNVLMGRSSGSPVVRQGRGMPANLEICVGDAHEEAFPPRSI
ncbi:MAG: hypothetical protein C0478_07115 [Planctomyces sp.]|nr:hypothetical protein [Planctomyces sp.]